MVKKMETLEVMGWITFFVIISLLFFAAFGTQNITEESIEEYMQNIIEQVKEGKK